jgi:hypothetical protein
MKKLIVMSIVMLSAALFFFSPARADQITEIQVLQSDQVTTSPQEDLPVAVMLLGTGNCKTLDLDWGDGTMHYLSTPPNQNYGFPWIIKKNQPYQNPGTYTIKIISVKGCQSTVLPKTITVVKKTAGGGIIQLCTTVNCVAALFAPKIDTFAIGSNITPGGKMAVVGIAFGNSPGQLHMVGYGPLIPFKLTDTVVQVVEWHNTWVSATIPANITGVVDQPVAFYVLTANNVKSNYSLTVPFTATRDMEQLPAGEVQVGCSDEADFDSCNNVVNSDSIPFCSAPFVTGGGGGTFTGFHWTCVGSSNGTDSFSASLKNGWRFNDAALADLTPEDLFSDDPKFANMSGFQSDATSTNVTLNWNNADASYVLYSVNVSIVGPKGVPHK